MNKNIYYYYILKDNSLIIEILKGGFDISEYMDLKQSEIKDPDYDSNFNIIIDIRNVVDVVSHESIKEYVKNVKPVQLFSQKIKLAVVTYSPSQVAGALLYKLFEKAPIDCEIFSTFEFALNWLGIDEIDLTNIDF